MKNLTSFNFQKLIGKGFRGIRSAFCKVSVYNGKTESYVDYKAVMHISVMEGNSDKIIDVDIESEWFEYSNGGDCLRMKLKYEDVSYQYQDSWSANKHKNLSSQISVLNFIISSIDLYGYNIDFNLVEPTEHIMLFKSRNGQEILIKPDQCGLGLLFSFDSALNKSFFEESAQSEFIYHIRRFE